MASELLDCTHKLRAAFRHHRAAALLQGAAGLALLILLLYSAHPGPAAALLVGLLLAAYGGRKLHRLVHARRSAQQLRLEEEFLRHGPPEAHLRQCLAQADHLWASSLILQGLRRILARPLPHLLTPEAKRQRLARSYGRAFESLRPPTFGPDLLLLIGAAAAWEMSAPPDTAARPLLDPALAVACAALTLELVQAALSLRMRRLFEAFAEALGAWTLQEAFEEKLRTPEKPYVHRLLYEASPWFTSPPRRSPPAPDETTPAL